MEETNPTALKKVLMADFKTEIQTNAYNLRSKGISTPLRIPEKKSDPQIQIDTNTRLPAPNPDSSSAPLQNPIPPSAPLQNPIPPPPTVKILRKDPLEDAQIKNKLNDQNQENPNPPLQSITLISIDQQLQEGYLKNDETIIIQPKQIIKFKQHLKIEGTQPFQIISTQIPNIKTSIVENEKNMIKSDAIIKNTSNETIKILPNTKLLKFIGQNISFV